MMELITHSHYDYTGSVGQGLLSLTHHIHNDVDDTRKMENHRTESVFLEIDYLVGRNMFL